MCEAMLTELDVRNCWTIAEALGVLRPARPAALPVPPSLRPPSGRDRPAVWTFGELADEQAVLVVDETGDDKSSTDCAGEARQCSGAPGCIGLCRVAVDLALAGRRGRVLIDRCLHVSADRAAACSHTSPTASSSPPSRNWPTPWSSGPAR
ncbi:transposase [Streptomyces sp. NPDC056105]|uniref:transposase n=1 Tax=Streptomyces sp. NPDC056105 TaxID=3345714 RepID=UPI0035E0E83F